MNDEPGAEERAVQDLADAVARVARLLLSKPDLRSALIAVQDFGLRALAKRIAAGCGFRVFLAETGAEATATAVGRPFDLILLEAESETAQYVRRLRALPAPLNAGAIIVLNVAANAAWRDAVAEAGADALVSAPVTPAALVEMITLLIGAQTLGTDERREA